VFHSILDGMKGEGEDGAEERARELVVNSSPGDDDVNDPTPELMEA
jgi:hypothetical protein